MPRVRRSLLFTPGHKADMAPKAFASSADAVCLDLEDAVPPEAKAEARDVVRGSLEAYDAEARAGGPEPLVRVNPLQGERWLADLEAVLPGAPSAIVVPKAEDPDRVGTLDTHLRELEEAHGIEEGRTGLLLLLETARGILDADAVAGAVDRTEALLFGAEDLAADVGATRTREGTEVAYARSHVVLAAGAHDLQALDQVYTDLEDPELLKAEALAAAGLGYTGKMAIHPAQVGPIHAAFTPGREEAREALRILEVAEEAGIEEGGVVRHEGRMLERPIVEQARRTVGVARHAGVLPLEDPAP